MKIEGIRIENYRIFKDALIDVGADDMIVVHGENGAGKSTIFAALDLFFRLAPIYLKRLIADSRLIEYELDATERPVGIVRMDPYDTASFPLPEMAFAPRDEIDNGSRVLIHKTDWPGGDAEEIVFDRMKISVLFADDRMGSIAVCLQPRKDLCQFWVERGGGERIDIPDLPYICARLEAWNRPPSSPLHDKPWSLMSAQRTVGMRHASSQSSFVKDLAEKLYKMKSARDSASKRSRWRKLQALVSNFPSMAGLTIDVEPSLTNPGTFDVIVEKDEKSVLVIDQLSAGEKQIMLLMMDLVATDAAIIAVEEPEISLSPQNQVILKGLMSWYVKQGLADQFILESHSKLFDGEQVLLVARTGNGSIVSRVVAETK